MIEKYKILDCIKREINPYGKPFKGTAYELGLKIMDFIKSMDDNNGWISVSERLPEESLNSVIGWDEYRKRCVFIQFMNGEFRNLGTEQSFKITAWMPLPEPYKEV